MSTELDRATIARWLWHVSAYVLFFLLSVALVIRITDYAARLAGPEGRSALRLNGIVGIVTLCVWLVVAVYGAWRRRAMRVQENL